MVIYAKYIGPTNTRSSKVKAWTRTSEGKIVNFQSSWNKYPTPHKAYDSAVIGLCMKLGIEGTFIHDSNVREPEVYVMLRASSTLHFPNIENRLDVYYLPVE